MCITMKVMDEPSWEPALTYRLLEDLDIQLLNRARTEVLVHLDFVTSDGAQCEDVSADINPAAVRLVEITEHWPAAIDANARARLAAERERE